MAQMTGIGLHGWVVAVIASAGCTAALDFDALQSGQKSSEARDTDTQTETGTDSTEPKVECDADTDCNDHIDCTRDRCDADGFCTQSPSNALCSGFLVCRIGEGCVDVGRECVSDAECDDGIDCTRNTCTSEGKCKLLLLDDDACKDSDDLCLLSATCDEELGCVDEIEKFCDQVDGPYCYNIFCAPSTGKCDDLEFRPGADKDGDGYCNADTDFGGDDCDDDNDAVHPGAEEIADNQADDDCDGETDEADAR